MNKNSNKITSIPNWTLVIEENKANDIKYVIEFRGERNNDIQIEERIKGLKITAEQLTAIIKEAKQSAMRTIILEV